MDHSLVSWFSAEMKPCACFFKKVLISEIINVQPLSLNPLADAMQRCEYQGREAAGFLPHKA